MILIFPKKIMGVGLSQKVWGADEEKTMRGSQMTPMFLKGKTTGEPSQSSINTFFDPYIIGER